MWECTGVCPGRTPDAGGRFLNKERAIVQLPLLKRQFKRMECTMALSQPDLIRRLESLRSTDGI
ncbi:hypothetical protein GCM10022403_034750 [Streptomyces coacervatus]|uniref:Uncharacterized protein n=1 Tax=Streptomyces coacervatus TaxID=647381 RepID=A0ABP7HNH9_9ACTN